MAVDNRVPLDGITGLFGPSGAGKTTLLRIISGLEDGTHSRVTFGDEVWQSDSPPCFIPAHRRRVGYVRQDARLFRHLSVKGNLRYAMRRRKGPVRYDDVVDALDLIPLLDRKPDFLSGGEKQRVAIGRALLSQPRLLLLDEPLSALDIYRKRDILPYFRSLPERFQVPMIYVTHAIEEIAQLADSIILLHQGRITSTGSVEEVFGGPDLSDITGHFEAGVILTATVQRHDPDYQLTILNVAGQEIMMPHIAHPPGSLVRIRLRARDISLALSRPERISTRNILPTTIQGITEEPQSCYAEVLLDMNGARLRARITRSAVAGMGLRPGQSVYALVKSVSFDRRLLVFDTPE